MESESHEDRRAEHESALIQGVRDKLEKRVAFTGFTHQVLTGIADKRILHHIAANRDRYFGPRLAVSCRQDVVKEEDRDQSVL